MDLEKGFLIDLYKLNLSMIDHQDEVINHRVTWILALSGLLVSMYLMIFGVYFFTEMQGIAVDTTLVFSGQPLIVRHFLLFINFIICAVGVSISLAAYKAVAGGAQTISDICEGWEEFIGKSENYKVWKSIARLPYLTHGYQEPVLPRGAYPQAITSILIGAWLTTLFLTSALFLNPQVLQISVTAKQLPPAPSAAQSQAAAAPARRAASSRAPIPTPDSSTR